MTTRATAQVELPIGADRDLLIGFGRAVELVESGDTRTALTVLHQLLRKLELNDDVLVPSDKDSFRSLKSKCMELMRSMTDADIEFYESQFGPEATNQLAEARQVNDRELLELVSRRFFFTNAGAQATHELGLRQLDSGEFLAAALTLSRLSRESRNPARFEPALSMAVATAFSRIGMTDSAKHALDRLKNDDGVTAIDTTVGKVSLTDTSWLADISKADTTRADWPVPLGNMRGTRESEDVVPVWKPLWTFNTLSTLVIESGRDQQAVESGFAETRRQLKSVLAMRKQNGVSQVPAPVPLVVAGRVILRSPLTMTALRLSAGDGLSAGEVDWETYKPDPAFMNAFREQAQVGGSTSAIFELTGQYAFGDLTSGTSSSDGRYVFSVEESRSNPDDGVGAVRGSLELEPNYLRAYGVDSGSVAWQIGGERGIQVAGMRGAVFLGPPLPFGDDLLAIVASRDELRLLQLHVSNPEAARPDIRLVWSQKLGRLEAQRGLSETIRLSGLMPVFGNGVLICPTGNGELVAVNPSSRGLLWRGQYERGTRAFRYSLGFLDSTPRIVGDAVVLASRDSSGVTCFDLQTGTPRWANQFNRGSYVIADKNSVITVGANRVHSYRLSDGQQLWAENIRSGEVAGRGLSHGNWISLPLTTGTVITMDRTTGRTVAKSQSPQPLGNLVAVNGTIVSLTPTDVVVFAGFPSFKKEVDTGLAGDPNNAELLATRATMRLQRGDLESALRDLSLAAKSEPTSRASELLIAAIDALEGKDLKRNIGLLKQLSGRAPSRQPPITLRGFVGPGLALRNMVSDLDRSLDFRLLLAELGTHEGLTEDDAESFVDRFVAFAERTSPRRLVFGDEATVAEPRYLSARIRKAIASRPDRRELSDMVLAKATNLLRLGEYHVVDQAVHWLTGDAAESLIEQYATAIAASQKAKAIGLLQSLRFTNTPDRRLRVIRLLVSLLGEHRPAVACNLIDEVRHGSQDHASYRDQLDAWKQQPELNDLVERTSIWTGRPAIREEAVESSPQYNIYLRDEFTRGAWSWIRRGKQLLAFDDQLRQRFSKELGPAGQEERKVFNAGGIFAESTTTLIAQHRPFEAVAYDLLGDTSAPLWTQSTSGPPADQANSARTALLMPVDSVVGSQVYLREPSQLTVRDLRTGDLLWSRRQNNMSRFLQIDSETVAVTTSPLYGGAIDYYSTLDGSWTGSGTAIERLVKQRIATTDRGRVDVRYTKPPGPTFRNLTPRPLRSVSGPLELVLRRFGSDKVIARQEFPMGAVFSAPAAGYCAVWNPAGLVRIIHLETLRVVGSAKAKTISNIQRVHLDVLPNRFVVLPYSVPEPGFGRLRRPSIDGSILGIDRVTGKGVWNTEVESQQLLVDNSNDGFLNQMQVTSRALPQPFPFYVLGTANSREAKPVRILDSDTGEFIYESEQPVAILEGAAYPDAKNRTIRVRVGDSISLVLDYANSK